MADKNVRGIRHFKQPRMPEVRFEWHPECQIVYVVQNRMVGPQEADPFAWNIKDHGAAWNAVLIWCRGYLAHKFNYAFMTAAERQEIMNHG